MWIATLATALLALAPAEQARLDSLSRALPPVQAIRLESPVDLDGLLSEPVWRLPGAVTGFTQSDPVEGGSPSERTEVRVAYDDEALYVGARMHDSHPDSIVARLARRDVNARSDEFALFVDPFHDGRNGYYFVVSAAGVLRDGTLFNDNWDDDSWDGVWQGKAHRDPQGWTCEIKVPFSQMRFQSSGSNVWGINFRRTVPRRSETDYVVFTPRKESGFVSRFPLLRGLDGVRARPYVEVLPYVTTKAEYLRHDAGDPFHDGSEYSPDGGADLRMGLGSNLTLNATANPDFGQVEVDPAVVNLSDVETFFQEKRPFFVEGSTIFNFGNQGASDYWGFNWSDPKFFYTRRVGRSPQGSVPTADFVDQPQGTTILGAGKVTGRLGSWTMGTVHALTGRETAKLQTGTTRWDADTEPLSYYGVARTQKEFHDSRQGFGWMTTLAARSFDDPRLRDDVNRHALMSGIDGWIFLDPGKVWVLSGWSAFSHVEGNRQRMIDLQRNGVHYFQRPDVAYLGVDSSATSLDGFGTRLWLNKEKGNTFANAAVGFMNPRFEVNDLGFQTRSDVINTHAGAGYRWTKPGKLKKSAYALAALFQTWDFGGNSNISGVFLKGSTEFNNNFSSEYWVDHLLRTLNHRATRGGPLIVSRPGYEFGAYFDTDGQKKRFYYIDAGGFAQESMRSGSWNYYVSPGIEMKPASSVSVEIGPKLQRIHEDAQYVTTVADPTATATYGHRYVFGILDQTTVSAGIRLNWSFTPALSLQLYAQPLISSASYRDFKELARGRTYEFNHYGRSGSTFDAATGTVDPDGPGPAAAFTIEPPDFNFRSLRGNAVLRWEYSPGSTLFLVWTQDRADSDGSGEFNFGGNARRLLEAEADNIFLAKLTYYFSL